MHKVYFWRAHHVPCWRFFQILASVMVLEICMRRQRKTRIFSLDYISKTLLRASYLGVDRTAVQPCFSIWNNTAGRLYTCISELCFNYAGNTFYYKMRYLVDSDPSVTEVLSWWKLLLEDGKGSRQRKQLSFGTFATGDAGAVVVHRTPDGFLSQKQPACNRSKIFCSTPVGM